MYMSIGFNGDWVISLTHNASRSPCRLPHGRPAACLTFALPPASESPCRLPHIRAAACLRVALPPASQSRCCLPHSRAAACLTVALLPASQSHCCLPNTVEMLPQSHSSSLTHIFCFL
ncbi:uncharacterized [Tachysurus ichikawai]